MSDYYSVTTYPWMAYFNNPYFYRYAKRKKDYAKLIDGQRFIRERIMALGPDLGAAHFLLARGCRIKFVDDPNWWTRELVSELPDVFEPNWFLESIDASDTKLIYEGFSSLKNLNSLKYLDMSYSQYLDAWMMDRITGEYGESLEYLDISGCKNLQWNGVEAIWRLSKLKTLVMRDSVRNIFIINFSFFRKFEMFTKIAH